MDEGWDRIMSSNVSHSLGIDHRPSWSYRGKGGQWQDYAQSQLEMMESCRNVMEDVRTELQRLNSLLHCANFVSIPHKLSNIVKNTTKRKYVKKVKS